MKYSKIFRTYYGITELRKEFSKSRESRSLRPHATLRPHAGPSGFWKVILGNRKEIKLDLLRPHAGVRPHAQRVKIRQKYSENRKEIGFGDLRGRAEPAPTRTMCAPTHPTQGQPTPILYKQADFRLSKGRTFGNELSTNFSPFLTNLSNHSNHIHIK